MKNFALIRLGFFRFAAIFAVAALGMAFLTACNATEKAVGTKGGIVAKVMPVTKNAAKPSSEELQTIREVISNRLEYKNIFDKSVRVFEEQGYLTLAIPRQQGKTNQQLKTIVSEIIKPCKLTFQEVDESKTDSSGSYKPTGKIVADGTDIINAKVETSEGTGEFVVSIIFNSKGARDFAEATGRLKGKPIGIFLDDQLISAPTVNEKISNGELYISGNFTLESASDLAAVIRSGSLPYKLEVKEIKEYK